MVDYRFERETRTPYSDSFTIDDEGGELVGRVDLHFVPNGIVHATLCVEDGLSEDDLEGLIADIDERLVMTADPYREEFVVSVWRGRNGGVYTEDDLEDDLGGAENGHNGHQ